MNKIMEKEKQEPIKTGIAFLVAAVSSGSGKTVISCGLMSALQERGMRVGGCKCGPDYIDPMFHREVLGVESENLDLFFCSPPVLKELFQEHVKQADVTVAEGVMGYYDGLFLGSDKASSYDVARVLGLPVILVFSCKGMALSALPQLLGILGFRENNHIAGIVLNRMKETLYPRIKDMLERGLEEAGYDIPIVGYVPEDPAFSLESRHLGLVTPEELGQIKEQLLQAGRILSQTIDMDRLLAIISRACTPCHLSGEINRHIEYGKGRTAGSHRPVRIGVARDKAFCFYYKDNLEFLVKAGCELVEFSPLKDRELPGDIQGLLLGGGYPELYLAELEANLPLRQAVKRALSKGLPCLAECGGFMYLHEELLDASGRLWQMAGAVAGRVFPVGRLVRFGYMELEGLKDGGFLPAGERIKGHEFHYWDSTNQGEDCLAVKPDGKRSWKSVHMNDTLFAGYPHVHFLSNENFALGFVEAARKFRNIRVVPQPRVH